MATYTYPFTNLDLDIPSSANHVNMNFLAAKTFLTTEVIQRDASIPMTAALSLNEPDDLSRLTSAAQRSFWQMLQPSLRHSYITTVGGIVVTGGTSVTIMTDTFTCPNTPGVLDIGVQVSPILNSITASPNFTTCEVFANGARILGNQTLWKWGIGEYQNMQMNGLWTYTPGASVTIALKASPNPADAYYVDNNILNRMSIIIRPTRA